MMIMAEFRMTQPQWRSTNDWRKLGRKPGIDSPQKEPTLPTPRSRTSSFQNWETLNFWGLSTQTVVVRYGNPSKLIQLLFHLIDEEIEIQTKKHAHQMVKRVRSWTVIVPIHSQCSFYQLYIINSSVLHQRLTYVTQEVIASCSVACRAQMQTLGSEFCFSREQLHCYYYIIIFL